MDETQTQVPRRGFRWKKALSLAALSGLLLLAAQLAYFTRVYETLPASVPQTDMVIVYSGPEDRTRIEREWARPGPAPVFLFSGRDYTPHRLERELKTGRPIIVEDRARTTDQNARYSAPLIRKAGARKAVLALPWYHLPRALFLTRYYLLGSGVSVSPYATTPLPKDWAMSPLFWDEAVKFWGSLARIGLSWFGIEDWPPPSGGG